MVVQYLIEVALIIHFGKKKHIFVYLSHVTTIFLLLLELFTWLVHTTTPNTCIHRLVYVLLLAAMEIRVVRCLTQV